MTPVRYRFLHTSEAYQFLPFLIILLSEIKLTRINISSSSPPPCTPTTPKWKLGNARLCQSFSMLHTKMFIICWRNCVNKWSSPFWYAATDFSNQKITDEQNSSSFHRVMGRKDNQPWNKSNQINNNRRQILFESNFVLERHRKMANKHERKLSQRKVFSSFCPTEWQMPLAQCQGKDASIQGVFSQHQLPNPGPTAWRRTCESAKALLSLMREYQLKWRSQK